MELSVYKRYEVLRADFWRNPPNQYNAINVPLFKNRLAFSINNKMTTEKLQQDKNFSSL